MEKRTILQRFMEWTRLDRWRKGDSNGKAKSRLEKASQRIAGTSAAAAGEACLDEGGTALAVSEPPEAESVNVRRLSSREETVMRIREGFKDLSGILNNIKDNIEDQAQSSRRLGEKLEEFPTIVEETRKGNEDRGILVETVARGWEENTLRQKEALKSLRALPVALAAIQENEIAAYKVLTQIREELAKRASFEQDMAQSFQNFDATLKEMGNSAKSQAEQLKVLEKSQKTMVEGFGETQQDVIESFQISQDLTVDTFKRAQGDLLHSFQKSQNGFRKRIFTSVGIIAAVMTLGLLVIGGILISALSNLTDSHETVARAALSQNRGVHGEIQRLKEQNLKAGARLNALLVEKQKEMDFLMSATKMEIEKLGEEQAAVVTQKNQEIEKLKAELAALEKE
jgi:hypothetical protein